MAKLHEAKVNFVAISYDSVETLQQFASKNKIQYRLLSDADSKAIDAFGLRNKNVRNGSRQDGIPHPGTVLLDKDGIVKDKLFISVRNRHTSDQLLEAIK